VPWYRTHWLLGLPLVYLFPAGGLDPAYKPLLGYVLVAPSRPMRIILRCWFASIPPTLRRHSFPPASFIPASPTLHHVHPPLRASPDLDLHHMPNPIQHPSLSTTCSMLPLHLASTLPSYHAICICSCMTSWCGVGLSSTVLAPAASATMDVDACSAVIDAVVTLAIMLTDA
jgi:hypothetical protein